MSDDAVDDADHPNSVAQQEHDGMQHLIGMVLGRLHSIERTRVSGREFSDVMKLALDIQEDSFMGILSQLSTAGFSGAPFTADQAEMAVRALETSSFDVARHLSETGDVDWTREKTLSRLPDFGDLTTLVVLCLQKAIRTCRVADPLSALDGSREVPGSLEQRIERLEGRLAEMDDVLALVLRTLRSR